MTRQTLYLTAILLTAFIFFSCQKTNLSEPETNQIQFDDSPKILIENAIKELDLLHEWILAGKPIGKENALLKIDAQTADSIWIYGDTLPGNIGVIITEKHAYPKGLLLITKTTKYGITPDVYNPPDYKIITITERYINWQQYNSNTPETKTQTELTFTPNPSDYIVTHIKRWKKDVLMAETYTFRDELNTIDTQRGVQTKRYADWGNATIITEQRKYPTGELLSRRGYYANNDWGNGGITIETSNYDGSGSNSPISITKTTTVGRGDGSIWRYIERWP